MTPARFQTIEEIFLAALEQEPDQVSTFLDGACEGDLVLRREVEGLLVSDQRAGRFIEKSAVGLATKVIQNQEADSLVGQTIDHYKISESIGTGGMGEVYLAIDIVARRKAALKLLPLRFTGDAERLKRFQQEAHAVVGLNHPNILTVYEIGEDHSIHYIVSELIEGETLREHLKRGPMQLSEAVDVAIQVASALAAAHQAGIVHRDIKPENIMVRPDGYVKVLDFGIAKLAESAFAEATADGAESMTLAETNLGSVLGTVRYMSPEQTCGAQVDKTTDIWSLGVVLYEMVTGHVPFTAEIPARSATALQAGPREVMSSILEKEPPLLTHYITHPPAELQRIISKTLRKDRSQRYDNAHELLQALKDLRRKLEADFERAAAPLWLRWARSPATLVLLLTVAALAVALPFYWQRNVATSLPPDKSIAVLPFENLSDDKEHAAFADGVQDDILTKLAKIADLKVISQTSVTEYRGKRNLRQIGNDLHVSHVLEGSVRRSGTHLRLNAQLIDTRNDTHVWAEQYDRDLNDLFAIQSEIAQKVAERLNAKVTSAERLAIEEKPTTDPTAFELYSRAGDLLTADTFKAIDLLNQAVARDPSFLKAYCLLVVAHDALYAFFDHTPARLALAEAALREAFRIRPNAGETHWARAYHLYNGYRDYDGALSELEVARQSLPNDPYVFKLMGSIQRRQGRWEESTRNLERAIELDPRDARNLTQTGSSYGMFRRYAEQKSKLDRALTVAPNDVGIKTDRAFVEVDWKADTGPLHQVIDEIRATNSAAVPQIADRWLLCALAERDVTAAKHAFLAAEFPLGDENVQFPRPFVEGVIARMASDEHKAQLAFTAAREKQEKTVNAQPDYAPAWCVLGVIDAALGRKEQALSEGRRAVELLPVEKDAIDGLVMIKYLAMSAVWVGDKDLACEQLANAVRHPGGLSYGELKLMPWWDSLRGDPRFEKIVEESKQPIALELVRKNAPQKSIAVLPFENASNEPNSEYLSEGISEALINSLSELQQLRVIARPTAFHYKRKDVDPRQVGRELGVAAVLTGKVRQMQDALNVQVDLVDPVTGAEIWGAGYDRKITDLVAVKQAIAQEVTAKLKLKLSSEDQRRLVKRDSTNAEAYQFYLRGRYFWNKRTSDGIKQAIEHFQQSIERDPNFALGYVGLADSYTGLTFYNFAAPQEAMPKAKESAIKALALDDTLAEAHATLAHILINYDWNSPAAEKEFKRSIELNPEYATAHQWYAIHYLTPTGRLEEAVQEMKKALELEPASLVMNTFMGAALYYAGRYDEAIDQCRRTIQMDPNFAVAHWHLGLAYEQKQLLDAATEEFRKAISLSGGSPLMKAALGRAYAKAQKTHQANEMLNELNELAKRQYASAYELATIYVALGNNEEAFQLLAKAYAEHSFHLVNLNVSPQFKSVRSDPRFQDLVQRIGLSARATAVTEKSIAVLPFENLSKDEENAFFAGGVQDEILNDLAKVADLKVISRTSVMQYKSGPERNLREIAKALGVSHVVEGSVQRTGERVRVSAQLIDARNDTHLWAEHYDRDVADVFAVQTEIAQQIADQLQAKLSPAEKAAIAERPTADLLAYAYYTKAKEIDIYTNWEGAENEKAAKQKVELLEKATQRDPNFALAYCALAKAQIDLENFELAKKAAETAVRLRPDLVEPHLALARYCWLVPDSLIGVDRVAYYDRARDELAIVRRKLPNNAEALLIEAVIGRHQNRWDASLANLQKASELDPRNGEIAFRLEQIYFEMRRYSELEQFIREQAPPRGAVEDPFNWLAQIKLAQGDPVAAQSLLEQVPPEYSPGEWIWDIRFKTALCLRDYDAANRVIAATPAKLADIAFDLDHGSENWAYGQVARARGDKQKAMAAFAAAREKREATSRDKPKDAPYFADIAKLDAALGRKEEAIREARRAIELEPIAKDALHCPAWIANLALVYAWTGERDRALEQLEIVATLPGYGPTYGDLLLNPCWDNLRGDKRFDKIVAAAKAASR